MLNARLLLEMRIYGVGANPVNSLYRMRIRRCGPKCIYHRFYLDYIVI